MENTLINQKSETTGMIELTLQDNQKKVRKATLYFDRTDNWFPEHDAFDVVGFFASAMMNMMDIDQTVILMQAKAYKFKNGIPVEWKECAPKIRVNGVFEFCFISNDGSVEILSNQ